MWEGEITVFGFNVGLIKCVCVWKRGKRVELWCAAAAVDWNCA